MILPAVASNVDCKERYEYLFSLNPEFLGRIWDLGCAITGKTRQTKITFQFEDPKRTTRWDIHHNNQESYELTAYGVIMPVAVRGDALDDVMQVLKNI